MKTIKLILLVSIILLNKSSQAQTPYATVKAKEYYDVIFEGIYNGSIIGKPEKYNEGSNANDLGDGGS